MGAHRAGNRAHLQAGRAPRREARRELGRLPSGTREIAVSDLAEGGVLTGIQHGLHSAFGNERTEIFQIVRMKAEFGNCPNRRFP